MSLGSLATRSQDSLYLFLETLETNKTLSKLTLYMNKFPDYNKEFKQILEILKDRKENE